MKKWGWLFRKVEFCTLVILLILTVISILTILIDKRYSFFAIWNMPLWVFATIVFFTIFYFFYLVEEQDEYYLAFHGSREKDYVSVVLALLVFVALSLMSAYFLHRSFELNLEIEYLEKIRHFL